MQPRLIQVPNSTLYRVVYSDGTISDMLNHSRANQALADEIAALARRAENEAHERHNRSSQL